MDNTPYQKQAPDEEQIAELLASIQVYPGESFQQRMQRSPWKRKQNLRLNWLIHINPAQRAGFLVAIFSGLILLTLFTAPFTRGLAKQIYRFFVASERNTLSIQITNTPEISEQSSILSPTFSTTIEDAQKLAGFDLHSITNLPEGMEIEGAVYDAVRKAILVRYTGENQTILFTQRKVSEIQEYASIGADASVQTVQVRGRTGEYALGGWEIISISPVDSNNAQNPSQTVGLIWDKESTLRTLRWEEDSFFYEIVYARPEAFTIDEVLEIAESIR
jgi:hypothetical protein